MLYRSSLIYDEIGAALWALGFVGTGIRVSLNCPSTASRGHLLRGAAGSAVTFGVRTGRVARQLAASDGAENVDSCT